MPSPVVASAAANPKPSLLLETMKSIQNSCMSIKTKNYINHEVCCRNVQHKLLVHPFFPIVLQTCTPPNPLTPPCPMAQRTSFVASQIPILHVSSFENPLSDQALYTIVPLLHPLPVLAQCLET